MSVFKAQFTRALSVIKSDNAGIPNPNSIQSGTNTALVAANNLTDIAATFVTNNVRTGDIVYNITDGTAATVVSVASNTSLTMNADIFPAGGGTGKSYIIYQNSSQTGLPNTGNYLYIGGAGNVAVVTDGNDTVTFFGVPAGTTLPIQVTQVRTATTATNIVALW